MAIGAEFASIWTNAPDRWTDAIRKLIASTPRAVISVFVDPDSVAMGILVRVSRDLGMVFLLGGVS